jgi:hypothetical protein
MSNDVKLRATGATDIVLDRIDDNEVTGSGQSGDTTCRGAERSRGPSIPSFSFTGDEEGGRSCE